MSPRPRFSVDASLPGRGKEGGSLEETTESCKLDSGISPEVAQCPHSFLPSSPRPPPTYEAHILSPTHPSPPLTFQGAMAAPQGPQATEPRKSQVLRGWGDRPSKWGWGTPPAAPQVLAVPSGVGGGVFCPAPSLSPTTIPPSRALAEGLLCGKAFQFWYPLLCLPKATGIWYLMRGREGLFVWPDGVQLPYSRDGGHGERGE